MTDARKFLGGAYLKAADLKAGQAVVTIEAVTEANMPDGKGGYVLHFAGKEKTLFLNTTNTNTLIDLFGSDTDDWLSQRVKLFVAKVDYQGKRVPAIRIDAAPATSVRQTGPPPPAEFEGDEAVAEDDMPF